MLFKRIEISSITLDKKKTMLVLNIECALIINVIKLQLVLVYKKIGILFKLTTLLP